MDNQIDFTLSTCTGIPPTIWAETSFEIDTINQTCEKLLWWLILFNILYYLIICIVNKVSEDSNKENFLEYTRGQFTAILQAAFRAFLVWIFLHSYKSLLIYFDKLIDELCLFNQNFDKVAEWRVVRIMHCIRVTTLLVSSKLGPLVALLTLMPDPLKKFRKGFSIWLESYITLSCLAININISGELARMFSKTSFLIKDIKDYTSPELLPIPRILPSPDLLQGSFEHTLLTIIIFIVTALTSTWAYKFVKKAITSHLIHTFRKGLERLGLRHEDASSL